MVNLEIIAQRCNDKKTSARLVSEASAKLFLSAFIKNIEPTEDAVVMNIAERSFDILVLNYDQQCRVYIDKLDIKRHQFRSVHGVPALDLYWPGECDGAAELLQTIKPCSLLRAQVKVNPNDMQKWTVSVLVA